MNEPMKPNMRAAYDQGRSFEGKAVRSLCYAPHVSLYFNADGDVRVCCHNWKHKVGNILKDHIDDIWQGARLRTLREALERYEFGPGCDFCYYRTLEGNFNNTAMRRFDRHEVQSSAPEWPKKFEFSISNSCNLECIMCDGIYSSAIRKNREKLPPIPRRYSDELLESLRKYLPHLENINFLGGEPFLVAEYQRIWDMLIEDNLHVCCTVSTNGTQYNKRVERILEQVPMSFSVSMDGATRETVESIRVNGNYDEIIENAKRFRQYAREKKTNFSLSFCFMRQNWHELGDYCLMADEWECSVYVNTVLDPPQFGVYTLPMDKLREVLMGMEAQAHRLERLLGRNRATWFGELDRVRAKCGNQALKIVA